MGVSRLGGPGSTAALALLNDAVKKGGSYASSSVGGLSGAFVAVSEDSALANAVERGDLTLAKLEAMTAVCSVGLDMIAVPGDTDAETLAALIADEVAIGVINHKTTAVRVIPVPGKKAGEKRRLRRPLRRDDHPADPRRRRKLRRLRPPRRPDPGPPLKPPELKPPFPPQAAGPRPGRSRSAPIMANSRRLQVGAVGGALARRSSSTYGRASPGAARNLATSRPSSMLKARTLPSKPPTARRVPAGSTARE